jgi:SSS family solute:Na+ symporter
LIPALVVFIYLGVVVYIGVFAFRHRPGAEGAEDYFLAGRALGPFVFLMSLFGTNMTAFAILGSSGHAFTNGIVTFGLMASASAFVIPLSLFLVGTRVWALGHKQGFITPVQLFRDRWETSHIGTVIFALQAALLLPYVIIGVIGGGTALFAISGGRVPFWLGGAVVALAVIGAGMGGFETAVAEMLQSPAASLLTRERVSPLYFLGYTFIPLSSIAFPHITIFCLTAKKMSQFKKTVVFYPLCIAAIWLPCVFLGVMANRATDIPRIKAKIEARETLGAQGPSLAPAERDALRAKANADDVLLLLLDRYAPVWLAGLLGAGIMAAVMATDSQILALSTMFTEDVFAHYGGRDRFGETAQVHMGRGFVVALTLVAYFLALRAPETIFALAVQYAFTGFAALSPLLVAALFWRGSTKWGALASTLVAAGGVAAVALFQEMVPAPLPGPPVVVWVFGGLEALARTPGGTAIFGFLPVVPITLASAAAMGIVSLLTPKPGAATLARYFPPVK